MTGPRGVPIADWEDPQPSDQASWAFPPPAFNIAPANGVAPLGNALPGAPAAPQMPVGMAIQRFPPENYPIPSAIEFQIGGTVATTAVGVTVIPGTLNLPSHFVAIIRVFDIFVNGPTAATVQQFGILINGANAPGFAARTVFGRAAQSIELAFDAFLRVPDTAVVSLFNNNIDGGSYTVGAFITGWYWPYDAGQAWMQGN